MLYVYVKEIPKECTVDVTSYFNFFKKKEWFDDPFVLKIRQQNLHSLKNSSCVMSKKLVVKVVL